MAEMQVNKQKIKDFLSSGKNFLIPEYQRPYSWEKEQCETLWNDIENFFEENKDKDEKEYDEYFLGSVVSFVNENDKNTLEIIDGQQRITTLSLLFRALYEKANNQTYKQENTKGYIKSFGKCIWKYDEGSEELKKNKPHLASKVILDSDNKILQKILSDNCEELEKCESLYAKNFKILCKKIDDFINSNLDSWKIFCEILLNKIVILPIECNNQENAMRIFTTLNDRGMPLSDSDIIKGIIYKSIDNKEAFAKKWKELESNLINQDNGEKYFDMNFLFVQYTHITRARNQDSSNEIGLRRFYTTKKYKDKDKVLRGVLEDSKKVVNEIEELQKFWLSIYNYDDERISLESWQMFNVLMLYPNEYWKGLVSAYYFYCRDKGLDFYNNEKILLPFLKKSVVNLCVKFIDYPSVDGIKKPIFNAYANFKEKKDQLDFKINAKEILANEEKFKGSFFSVKKLTNSIISLYLYIAYPEQEVIIDGEIEHILPQKWKTANYNNWNEEDANKYLEQIGNKMLLEKIVNIKARNACFKKKKEEYKESKSKEAQELANGSKNDWIKEDIEERNEKIYTTLKAFFEDNIN